MVTEGKRSKGRFLYVFDWNAKSRKKLFSNKSESTEGSVQGKDNVNDLVNSQYQLREVVDYPSFRGNGNHSCSSSVNGDQIYGARPPGVVARLMGLDTMPATASCEESYEQSYESCALSSSFYSRGVTPSWQDCGVMNRSYAPNRMDGVTWSSMDSSTIRAHGLPFEKFQAEVLPPKSAKPISITHHRLLSPVKSPGFVPFKDAAYIMEAAARIIDPAPPSTGRAKISSLGSPSSSFRIQDLRDRMDAAQRSFKLPETPKTPKQSPRVHKARENQSNRPSHRSLFKNIIGSQTSSSQKLKSKVKSVSVPVQDKSNTQKRNSLACSSRSQLQKEHKREKVKQKEPNAQMEQNIQNAGPSSASRKKTSGALRQNSGKQNSVSNRDKSSSKSSVSAQPLRKGDNTAGPRKIVNKISVNRENGLKKTITTVSDRPQNGAADRQPSLNRMKNISRSKQTLTRDDCVAEHTPDNSIEATVVREPSPHSDSRRDMNVISFTFTSPIKRLGSQSVSSAEAIGTSDHVVRAESKVESQSVSQSFGLPPVGLKLVDSGSLSRLLEQKLQELTDKIGSSQSDALSEGPDVGSLSCLSESISSHGFTGTNAAEDDDWSDRDQTSTIFDDECSSSVVTRSSLKGEDSEGFEEHFVNGTTKEVSLECRIEHHNITLPECSISGSWMSSAASDFAHGYDQHSSPQSLEVTSSVSTESAFPREDDTYFVDETSYWELEYVKYMLQYAGLKKFRLVEGCKIIDPGLFDLLENLIHTSGRTPEQCSKLERRILFDCVTESVTHIHERTFVGNCKSWVKWCIMLQSEWLAEEVHKDIFCWQSMGNLMVDELVDWDMSTQHGKWLNFEIESLEEGIEMEINIISDLVDELVADLSVQILSRW